MNRGCRMAFCAVAILMLAACATQPTAPHQGREGMDRVSPVRAAEVNTRLGLGYLERGQTQVAMEKLETALRHDPQHTPAHLTLALIYESLGNTSQAARHYRQASRLAPNDGATQNAYAVFLCRQGQFDEAQRHFDQAFDDPFYQTPEVAYGNAGACARRAGRLDQAERYLRQALDLNPDYYDSLYQLAVLHLDRGDAFRARAFLQRLESLAAPDPVSLLLGYRVESQLNNPRDAERYASLLESDFPDSAQARELRSLRQNDE